MPQNDLDRQLERIATAVFARRGVNFADARRALGWSNATWLAGGLALRLSVSVGSDRLLREARLAALLPAQVGYPEQLESGETEGFAWVLSREIVGACLGAVWPTLDWPERSSALRQLWEKAQVVHTVSIQAVANLARRQAWFNATDAAEAEAVSRRLHQRGLLTLGQLQALTAALRRFWSALACAAPLLNHGDLTLDNAIWRDGQVVALLDFEFAVLAPVALDFNVLATCVFGPLGAEPDPAGRVQAQRDLADLAAPLLAQPGMPDLLLGYAILLEQWHLEDWLAHPEGEGPLESWEPYRRLLSLADSRGGYYRALLQRKALE